jgi:predicted small secreted protein
MRKLYTGKLYGLAAPTKKKLTEKQVLEVLNQAEAEFPTIKGALIKMNEKHLDTSDFVLLFNQYESLVMEWKKKWLSYESQNKIF